MVVAAPPARSAGLVSGGAAAAWAPLLGSAGAAYCAVGVQHQRQGGQTVKRKPTGGRRHGLKQPRRKGLRGRDRLQLQAAAERRTTRERELCVEAARGDEE